jgi:MFS superfamily sulfate permease-like transporter
VKTLRIGAEQLVIFTFTLVVTLATDLLVGVAAGIALKTVLHVFNGAPLRSLFRPEIETHHGDGRVVVRVRHAAVFTNYLTIKKHLQQQAEAKLVELDLSQARLVDHTTMERLHELEHEFAQQGRHLRLLGLEQHRGFSEHPLAARKKVAGTNLGLTS